MEKNKEIASKIRPLLYISKSNLHMAYTHLFQLEVRLEEEFFVVRKLYHQGHLESFLIDTGK